MKKRYIIALIITLIILGLSRHYWLICQTKTHVHFEFFIFTIIFICGYLLSLKLTEYLAGFKNLKQKSRIEIIFLTVFFSLLYIPMSHINHDEISSQENRTLNAYKPLFLENYKINYNFGNNFNSWFNDRFYLRNKLINLYQKFIYSATSSDKDTYNNSKGMIDKTSDNFYLYPDFQKIKIDVARENFIPLYEFNDWCKKHNIKCYILITPPKVVIYKPKSSYLIENDLHEQFLKFIDTIQKEGKLKVIYPYSALYEAKDKESMFFKTDHHWTDDGAFIGYKELMKVIKKDFPNIRVLNENDFNYSYNNLVRGDFERSFYYGVTARTMGIPDLAKYHKTKYRFYTFKNINNIKKNVIDDNYHKDKIYYYDKGANYRVIQIGTSQNENLTEFIPPTFKNVKRIRNSNVKGVKNSDTFKIMKRYEKEMLDYKPDIIILGITYHNIEYLRDLFNKE